MSTFVSVLSGTALVFAAIVCAWTVITQRLVLALGVEWGLGFLTFGTGSAGINLMVDMDCSTYSHLMQLGCIAVGMLLVAGSVWIKALKIHHPLRRLSDFKAIAMKGWR